MTIKKQIIVGAIMSSFIMGATFAEDNKVNNTPRVDLRQDVQGIRIDKGIESGRLTPLEAAKLEARQAKIEIDKQRAKADGIVTNRERVKLHRELDNSSRAIYAKKHNRNNAVKVHSK